MRRFAVVAAAALAGCAGSVAKTVYVTNAETAFAAGRWGEAMAGYDAAHNEAPTDEAIAAKRSEAAAKWVESMAPALAKEAPPEKAFALLNALAAEGNKRGAQAAVQQHVAGPLESALAAMWTGEVPGDDPKALWQAISRGENLTQSLPETSATRVKVAALRQRGSQVFGKLASEAKHPSSAFLYAAMAARMTDSKPAAPFFEGVDAVTALDYRVSLATPKNCPQLAPELKKRMDFFKNFDPRSPGLKAELEVQVECGPLAPPTRRQESRSWVEKHLDSVTIPGSCVDRKNIAFGGSVSLAKKEGMGGVVTTSLVSTDPTYSTVPDCGPSRTYFTERSETKSDVVTITTEEVGINAAGSASLSVNGKTYVMPLSSRVVTEKITTEGAIFGSKEEMNFLLGDFVPVAAHGLWLELTFLAEKANAGYANELLARSAAQQGDARTGDMVSAVRVHQLVSKDAAKFFADTLGLEDYEVKELVVQTPRVMQSVKVSKDYKLDVPRVDANVARAAEEKKKAAGEDAFK